MFNFLETFEHIGYFFFSEFNKHLRIFSKYYFLRLNILIYIFVKYNQLSARNNILYYTKQCIIYFKIINITIVNILYINII